MVATRYIPIPLLALAFLPTLLVEIPATADYLNHLSRMYLITNPASNPYYEVSFAFYTNLAMDLIVPKIARLMSVENAARAFFLFSQLLVVFGAVAIELVVKRRLELSLLAALLCLHTTPFASGFVNFEFGVGIAVCGIASWIACRGSHWLLRLAVHSLFVGALIVSHFFALGIYGLTLGLYELHRFFSARISWREVAATIAILAGPVLVLLATLYETGGAIGGSESEWIFSWKAVWFALFFNGYDVSLSAGTAAVLIVLVGYLIVTRSLVPSPAALWIAVGFLVAYLVLPFKIFDSRMADIRVITGALLVLPAFVSVRPDRRLVTHVILASLIVLNAGYTAFIWLSYRSDYAAMKASFALLRPASFVLVGHSSSTGEIPSTLLTDQPIYRAPVLAVHYAGAFVSSLYTIAGTVPVEVRADLKHLDVDARTESYIPPTLATLRALAAGENVPGAAQYLKNWTRDFQYVYLVGRPTENAFPGVLDELVRHDRFTLYAVRK